MGESFVDISKHYSKTLEELSNIDFDYVITVCDNAKETCPIFNTNRKILHKSFDDPPELTKNIREENEKLKIYRRVRDEIYDFVKYLPRFLKDN
jgi:arsenate reductase